MAVLKAHNCPDTERGYTGLKAGSTKEGCQPDGRDNWAPRWEGTV